MTGLEYIQKQINLVKQQIKGSKIKFIITDTDPVTKVKKLQYDFYENELQTLESIEKSLKALEIIKEHIKFEDRGIETYTDDSKNLVTKFLIRLESKDTGATIHIHLDTEEEFNLLKEVLE